MAADLFLANSYGALRLAEADFAPGAKALGGGGGAKLGAAFVFAGLRPIVAIFERRRMVLTSHGDSTHPRHYYFRTMFTMSSMSPRRKQAMLCSTVGSARSA